MVPVCVQAPLLHILVVSLGQPLGRKHHFLGRYKLAAPHLSSALYPFPREVKGDLSTSYPGILNHGFTNDKYLLEKCIKKCKKKKKDSESSLSMPRGHECYAWLATAGYWPPFYFTTWFGEGSRRCLICNIIPIWSVSLKNILSSLPLSFFLLFVSRKLLLREEGQRASYCYYTQESSPLLGQVSQITVAALLLQSTAGRVAKAIHLCVTWPLFIEYLLNYKIKRDELLKVYKLFIEDGCPFERYTRSISSQNVSSRLTS